MANLAKCEADTSHRKVSFDQASCRLSVFECFGLATLRWRLVPPTLDCFFFRELAVCALLGTSVGVAVGVRIVVQHTAGHAPI